MGRTLNTLRNNGTAHPSPKSGESGAPKSFGPPIADTVGFAPIVSDENVPAGPEPVGGDVPFIEVGPRRKVSASPDVLAIPLAPPAKRPSGVAFRGLHTKKKSKIAEEIVAFHDPDAPAARQYVELLGALVDAARSRPGTCQVLLFTGTRPEAGCTTATLNVAVTAARDGFKVAVIDANLRRPGVAARLGLEHAPGLAEVLAAESEAHEALRETDQENLLALTAGSPTPVLADLAALNPMMDEMREAFDFVLIDGPRWDGRIACLALAEVADAMFLVVPNTEADTPPASVLVSELPTQGVRLAGCVLTTVP